MNTITLLGTALYETHGKYCNELIAAGYDLDNYYDTAKAWGDFDKVLVIVAIVRGAKSYDEYTRVFDAIAQPGDSLVTKQFFSRLTGIKATNDTQTTRTRLYRQRTKVELESLRESTAKAWIDSHHDEALKYITDTTVVK